MMRWPSAYWATSSGMSRLTMRNSTQPTRPAELRTRYQSSITGLGGSVTFPLVVSSGFCAGLDGGVGGGCEGFVAEACGVWLAELPAGVVCCFDFDATFFPACA